METTLHQQLKRCYADDESQTEVAIGRYRIDAVRGDELIEIQCASLSAIGNKCKNLLARHSLRVVKPIIARKRIVKLKSAEGPVISKRMSPKRSTAIDAFEDLIYFTRVFPHPNLTIEIPLVEVEQFRIPTKKRRRKRGKDYQVQDVHLQEITATHEIRVPSDLLDLLQLSDELETFNTSDLATAIDRPRWVAQKIAYVLRKTGAIDVEGRNRTGIVYHRAA